MKVSWSRLVCLKMWFFSHQHAFLKIPSKIYWKKKNWCGDRAMEFAFWADNNSRHFVVFTVSQELFWALDVNSFFTATLSGVGAIVIIPIWQRRNLRYQWLGNSRSHSWQVLGPGLYVENVPGILIPTVPVQVIWNWKSFILK